MSKTELVPARQRRSYPKPLKAQIVAQCSQPGVSVAGVALSHDINANLVRKWVRQAGAMAGQRSWRLRVLAARVVAMIPVEAIWLTTEPLDVLADGGTALARVVAVSGAARAHHAYCFANRRANRMKVLVHDG